MGIKIEHLPEDVAGEASNPFDRIAGVGNGKYNVHDH